MRIPLAVLLLCAAVSCPVQAEFACAGEISPALVGVATKAVGLKGSSVPAKGRIDVLVVYAAFAGETPAPPPAWAEDLLDLQRTGSLTHFYHAMSFGQLTLGGTILPRRYQSREPASAYLAPSMNEGGDFGRFSVEVLEQLDRDVDLRHFDNDGPDGRPNSGDDDGFVDYVFINLRNVPARFLRGNATGIGGLGQDYISNDIGRDGNQIRVRGGVGKGAIQQEGGFSETVGVMAHEFGHGLGLPDLYDINYADPSDDSAGIGRWGLMGWGAVGWNGADGPNPLSAWSLERLGWISAENGRLTELADDTMAQRLEPVHAGGTVLRIPLGGGTDHEYLLLAQRTRGASYYDRALPGEGLLVWRIRPGSQGNLYEDRKLVDLVCADGMFRDAGYPVGMHPDGQYGGDNLDFWSHDEAYNKTHGGNWGDATDPFDGIQRSRLHMATNPSTMPVGVQSHTFTGLNIVMEQQPGAMEVQVTMPRWAGTVTDEATWAGDVWIDGDLHVAPGGRLIIEEGTRVHVAGQDRLRGGLDADHVEIDVQGDLQVAGDRILFEPTVPGSKWYGILLQPTAESEVLVQADGLNLNGALHGISFPGAPAGYAGQTLAVPRLIDVSGPRTAGNGDGELSPGETFQVSLQIDNWSLETYPDVRGQLRWLTPDIVNSVSSKIRGADLDFGAIYPGVERAVAWPSLTLSPQAAQGDEISFSVAVHGLGHLVQRESLNYVVRGGYPAHSARLEILDRAVHEGLAVVPQAAESSIEAVIEGSIMGADLVVSSLDDQGHSLELPMERVAESVYRVDFQPPGLGAFDVRLRVRGTDGSVAFSEASLDLWALEGTKLPVLALLASKYSASKVERVRVVLQERVESLGLDLHLMQLPRSDPGQYERLLSYYGDRGGIVIWVAELGIGVDRGLRELLIRGGRLLLASNVLSPSTREREFLESMLLTVVGGRSNGATRLEGLFPLEGVSFPAQHAWLSPMPPAEPILVNRRSQTTGLRLETGGYRVVFLPFDLNFLDDEIVDAVFGPSLLFLGQEVVRESFLGIEDAVVANQSIHSEPGRSLTLRAQVEGDVSRAEVIISRGAPNFGEHIGALALQLTGTSGALRQYRVVYRPPEAGRFRLALRLYDDEGNVVVTSARLNVLVHDTEPDVLILQDQLELGDDLVADASILHIDSGDWQVLDQLLSRYLDPEAAVVYLGGSTNSRILDALGTYTGAGGNLLLVSEDLVESSAGEAFLREAAGVARPSRVFKGQVQTHDLVAGADLTVPLFFHRFDQLLAPAVPWALSQRGEIAGVSRRTQGGQVVYLPIDPARLRTGDGLQFARTALRSVRQSMPVDADLLIPDTEINKHHAMLQADRTTAIQARVSGPVAGVDLLVQAYDDVTDVVSVPMIRRGTDLFEVPFRPPAVGHYLLFLRLRTNSGDRFLASSSLRTDAFTFQDVKPVLLMLSDQWSAADRSAVTADVLAALQHHGLDANVVAVVEDGPMVESLLASYLYQGKMVVWLGRMLKESGLESMRRYLGVGGRLFMASADVRYSPGAPAFLRDWLGVDDIAMGFPTRGKQFFLTESPARPIDGTFEFAPMGPADYGEVALLEGLTGVAGIRVAGDYRSVFYSFNMHRLAPDLRRHLLADQIAFLATPEAGQDVLTEAPEAILRLRSAEVATGFVAIKDLAPSLVVGNDGNSPTAPFRVGYQVLQDDQLVATVLSDEQTLGAGEERTITLAAWPEAVTGDFRIRLGTREHPDSALQITHEQPLHLAQAMLPFRNLTLPGAVSRGNGATLFDYDSDGDLDVYLVRRGGPDRLWSNSAGVFVDVSRTSGLAVGGNGRGVALGDTDADGDLDVYLVTEEQNYWFRNDGAGEFTDLSADLSADDGAGRSAAFFDADGDGDLDLYVVNATGANRLFVHQDNGYVEAAARFGLADEGSGRGLATADLDDDGDTDLFLANSTGGSRLLLNEGGLFVASEEEAGLALAGGEAGVAIGDVNGDGRQDLFVARESGPNRLFENGGGGVFHDVVRRDSLDLGEGAVGAAFLDVDNDGDLDLVTTAANAAAGGDELYFQRQPYLLPAANGLGLMQSSDGRGLSVGDVDGDGRVDLLVADAKRSRMYRNTMTQQSWLRVQLAGNGANRWGIGARVEVWLDGTAVVDQVYAALGYGSQTQPVLHFGLSNRALVDSVVAWWPDGVRSVEHSVPEGATLVMSPPEQITAVTDAGAVPTAVRLEHGYPNPFNASTTIQYSLPTAGDVRLTLYAANGQVVCHLVNTHLQAGTYQAKWDGVDGAGRRVASGVYFMVLQTGNLRRLGRLALIE